MSSLHSRLAALVLGVLLSTDALAQSRPPPRPQGPPARPVPTEQADAPAPPAPYNGVVDVQLICVRATNNDSQIDSALTSIAAKVKVPFTGLHLLSNQTLALRTGDEGSFTLTGGRKITVELVSANEKNARLHVQMYNKAGDKQVDTTVQVPRNRTFMIQGPDLGDGDKLVLPVTPSY